jgi:hypothetical protein
VGQQSLRDSRGDYVELATAYKQINATKGSVGRDALIYANQAININNKAYKKYLDTIVDITDLRNEPASEMIAILNAAAFSNAPVGEESGVVNRAERLSDRAANLAEGGEWRSELLWSL